MNWLAVSAVVIAYALVFGLAAAVITEWAERGRDFYLRFAVGILAMFLALLFSLAFIGEWMGTNVYPKSL